MTKAAWVRLYEMGILKDSWIFKGRNSNAIVIVQLDANENHLFGYIENNGKKFFKVGYTPIEKFGRQDIKFEVSGKKFTLSSFKRL